METTKKKFTGTLSLEAGKTDKATINVGTAMTKIIGVSNMTCSGSYCSVQQYDCATKTIAIYIKNSSSTTQTASYSFTVQGYKY